MPLEGSGAQRFRDEGTTLRTKVNGEWRRTDSKEGSGRVPWGQGSKVEMSSEAKDKDWGV